MTRTYQLPTGTASGLTDTFPFNYDAYGSPEVKQMPFSDLKNLMATNVWARAFPLSPTGVTGSATAQAVPLITVDPLPPDGDEWGFVSSGTGFTIPPGYNDMYLVFFQGQWVNDGVVGQDRELSILVDGSTFGAQAVPSVTGSAVQWQQIYVQRYLTAGQVVTFRARHGRTGQVVAFNSASAFIVSM